MCVFSDLWRGRDSSMKAQTGEEREVSWWEREMVTGEESWVEMASLLLMTVAEMTTLFTLQSVGQITGASPYHGLWERGNRVQGVSTHESSAVGQISRNDSNYDNHILFAVL